MAAEVGKKRYLFYQEGGCRDFRGNVREQNQAVLQFKSCRKNEQDPTENKIGLSRSQKWR